MFALAFFVRWQRTYRMLRSITPAANPPIDLTDLKAHLGIDGTQDDTRLTALLAAATDYVERACGKSFSSATWEETFDQWPGRPPYFPVPWDYTLNRNYYLGVPLLEWNDQDTSFYVARGPLQSVTSIQYFDGNNTLQTVDPSLYFAVVGTYNAAGKISPLQSWPVAFNRPDAITVRYVSGTSPCPEIAKHAIRLLVGAWNENREDFVPGQAIQQIPLGVARLIDQLDAKGYR